MTDEKDEKPKSELERRLIQPHRPQPRGGGGMITNDSLRPLYPPTVEGGIRLSLNRRRG